MSQVSPIFLPPVLIVGIQTRNFISTTGMHSFVYWSPTPVSLFCFPACSIWGHSPFVQSWFDWRLNQSPSKLGLALVHNHRFFQKMIFNDFKGQASLAHSIRKQIKFPVGRCIIPARKVLYCRGKVFFILKSLLSFRMESVEGVFLETRLGDHPRCQMTQSETWSSVNSVDRILLRSSSLRKRQYYGKSKCLLPKRRLQIKQEGSV